jgi:hypothetical protein
VGHANRPRLHHALGLDAQSRRLCLSSARRCESDTNTNGLAYSDSYGNSNPHGDCHSYADTETYTEAYTVAEAASYAAAATIAR